MTFAAFIYQRTTPVIGYGSKPMLNLFIDIHSSENRRERRRRMTFRIIQIDSTRLKDYQKISIAFEVRSIYDVTDDHRLVERQISTPYIKDYDQITDEPWSTMNLTNWRIFLLLDQTNNDEPIGGAIVIMPECILWDLRVAPKHRRLGVGRALFEHILTWIRTEHKDQSHLTIETQNTNVAACRFYASIGAILIDVDRKAYVDVEAVKDEIRLNWTVEIRSPSSIRNLI